MNTQPTIQRLGPLTILGVRRHVDFRRQHVQSIWDDGFMPHHERIKALAVEPGYYGVRLQTADDAQGDYLAGMRVPAGMPVPAGLDLLTIPEGLYAVFAFTAEEMQDEAPAYAHYTWLPASLYRRDPHSPIHDYTLFGQDPTRFVIPLMDEAGGSGAD